MYPTQEKSRMICDDLWMICVWFVDYLWWFVMICGWFVDYLWWWVDALWMICGWFVVDLWMLCRWFVVHLWMICGWFMMICGCRVVGELCFVSGIQLVVAVWPHMSWLLDKMQHNFRTLPQIQVDLTVWLCTKMFHFCKSLSKALIATHWRGLRTKNLNSYVAQFHLRGPYLFRCFLANGKKY